MKEDVVFDPAQVTLFGFDAVVLDTNQVANLSNCDIAVEAIDQWCIFVMETTSIILLDEAMSTGIGRAVPAHHEPFPLKSRSN